MSFNPNSAKIIHGEYKAELSYQDNIRSILESKAASQMQITGVILGLYGTMSTIFFISAETLTSSNKTLLNLYVATAFITVILLFCSLVSSLVTIRVKEWDRPIQKLPKNKSNTDPNIEYAENLCNYDEKEVILHFLRNIVYSITLYSDNNDSMARIIRLSYYFIVSGLISFIFSIITLISIGVVI